MSKYILDFEKPIKAIEDKIISLNDTSSSSDIDLKDSITSLNFQLENEKKRIYSNLSRWQKIQIARHPQRPHSSDFIKYLSDEWIEIHGDRKFSDDPSIIAGISMINESKCIIIAQEKGKNTKDKVYRNFGMPKPEGYRKALRVMKIAEKFNLPIVTLIDTPGAYPGIGAEERGQSQAIADNLFTMSSLKVPIISIVIGEGASGGALAIGLADTIICLEYTWYSVISPEGCASILFRDTSKSPAAADSMKVSSVDLLDMGIADEIIHEPLGGAHHNPDFVFESVKNKILEKILIFNEINSSDLIDNRLKKYDNIGVYNKDKNI